MELDVGHCGTRTNERTIKEHIHAWMITANAQLVFFFFLSFF